MLCEDCFYKVVIRIQRYFSDLTDLVCNSCGNENCWLYMKDIKELYYCEHYKRMWEEKEE